MGTKAEIRLRRAGWIAERRPRIKAGVPGELEKQTIMISHVSKLRTESFC